jgi:uncharacterized membrane protein YeiB
MSLNLIPPKDKKAKQESNIGVLVLKKAKDPEKLIYIIGILIALFLLGSFYLIVQAHKAGIEKQLKQATSKEQELREEIKELKEGGELSNFQTKLSILENLVEKHKYWLTSFELLETLTLPRVQFTSFKADTSHNKITLNVKTVDFRTLAEQLIIFRNHRCIKEANLNGFHIEEGGVNFGVDLILLDEAWQDKGCQDNTTQINEF